MWNKIQRIYIGSQKVRPNHYKYSYDFRGKTIAQVNSDLWTTFTSAYSIDANWLKATSWDAVYFQLPWSDYSTANKITMMVDGYIGSSWINDVSFRAALYQNGSGSNHTWNYITPWSWNWLFIWGTKQAYTNTISNYNFSLKSVFNLQTKVASIEYTLGSSFSNTYTITDAQVTNIRWLNYYWIALNWQGHIKKFTIIIEY